MAVTVYGRVKMELTNNLNKSFNEYPFYTDVNFCDGGQTDKKMAEDFQAALAQATSQLTTNTLDSVKIEYTVDLMNVT